MTIPKAFISYCWTAQSHQDWVLNLAERLVSDGIDVIIDKWDLKEGQDKFTFMENMVNDSGIDKVLIILDEKYSKKADNRSGGVGTETQIISPQIYQNVSQEKFIPIIAAIDEEGNAFIPSYLNGRIYIDLSVQEQFEQNYEILLRCLYKRPTYNKPKIGKAPSYLFEETPMTHKTTSIIRSFDYLIGKNPKQVNSIIKDFLDEFFDDIKNYSLKFTNRDAFSVGKEIIDCISSYTPLRNDFVLFFDKLTKENILFDIDIVIKFLEKFPLLLLPQDGRNSWSDTEFDHFRFFFHELFLYLIAVGIRNENYKFIEDLLYSSYFFHDKYERRPIPKSFGEFYHNIDIITPYYNENSSQTFQSPMADIMMKRIPENFSSNYFIEADMLCHYIGVLNDVYWFPLTYIYEKSGKFEIFDRLISKRHYEKTKSLFNSTTPQDLKDKLNQIKEKEKNVREEGYRGSMYSIPKIYFRINIDTIASTR